MGLLTVFGNPMNWGTPENDAAIPKVLNGGIQQFLAAYARSKNLSNMPFLWGEELEHCLVEVQTLPDGKKVLKLAVNAAEVLGTLSQNKADAVDWHPEYGSFMVESIPNNPYGDDVTTLGLVEKNMRQRYTLLNRFAGPNRFGLTLVTYPLMGQGDFTNSGLPFSSDVSQSLFVPDICINQTHPRFFTLTRNIRLRRGRKVCIQVPLYIDTNTMEQTVDAKYNIDDTPLNRNISCKATEEKVRKGSKFGKNGNASQPAEDTTISSAINGNGSTDDLMLLYTPATDYYYAQYGTTEDKAKLVEQRYNACPCPTPSVTHPCIYMDCMAFGMGCHCLQVTMQLSDINEARFVYDQLVVLCPAFLALTSATPFQKGLLCDSDVRWLTIAGSVDDRKKSEVPRIIKSRYDSVSAYISNKIPNANDFNDNHIEINKEHYETLTKAGLDPMLAQHVAHMFIRDPLVIYDQAIDIDNNTRMEHFESIQSTNWQTIRFKPPPPDSTIGWRVEFRVMDIMPTPFENAAFSVFIALLTKAIVRFELFMYTKMSLVDENMGTAHKRNPCAETYHTRRNPFCSRLSTSDDEIKKMTVNEIFNGSEDYIGLIEIVRKYMRAVGMSSPLIERYLKFISMRAAGTIPTTANYFRNFIMKHADYKHDSRLTDQIALDLALHVKGLADGTIVDESYLPAELFDDNALPPKIGDKRARSE